MMRKKTNSLQKNSRRRSLYHLETSQSAHNKNLLICFQNNTSLEWQNTS